MKIRVIIFYSTLALSLHIYSAPPAPTQPKAGSKQKVAAPQKASETKTTKKVAATALAEKAKTLTPEKTTPATKQVAQQPKITAATKQAAPIPAKTKEDSKPYQPKKTQPAIKAAQPVAAPAVKPAAEQAPALKKQAPVIKTAAIETKTVAQPTVTKETAPAVTPAAEQTSIPKTEQKAQDATPAQITAQGAPTRAAVAETVPTAAPKVEQEVQATEQPKTETSKVEAPVSPYSVRRDTIQRAFYVRKNYPCRSETVLTPGSGEINIRSLHGRDATTNLQQILARGEKKITNDNIGVGDPQPGYPKMIVATYYDPISIPENSAYDLTTPDLANRNYAAFYGEGSKWVNVTGLIREIYNGKGTASNTSFGDASPKVVKNLIILLDPLYIYEGSLFDTPNTDPGCDFN